MRQLPGGGIYGRKPPEARKKERENGVLPAPQNWRQSLCIQDRDILGNEVSPQADSQMPNASCSCLGITAAVSSCVTGTA